MQAVQVSKIMIAILERSPYLKLCSQLCGGDLHRIIDLDMAEYAICEHRRCLIIKLIPSPAPYCVQLLMLMQAGMQTENAQEQKASHQLRICRFASCCNQVRKDGGHQEYPES